MHLTAPPPANALPFRAGIIGAKASMPTREERWSSVRARQASSVSRGRNNKSRVPRARGANTRERCSSDANDSALGWNVWPSATSGYDFFEAGASDQRRRRCRGLRRQRALCHSAMYRATRGACTWRARRFLFPGGIGRSWMPERREIFGRDKDAALLRVHIAALPRRTSMWVKARGVSPGCVESETQGPRPATCL